jgi:hypothetical protein
LRRTQELASEKEKLLSDLGIQIGENGHIDISSPKSHPHLLNLQPNSLQDSLVHTLMPGRSVIGSATDARIRLNDLSNVHAVIRNGDAQVFLYPKGPDIFINGRVAEGIIILQSGDALKIRNHLFRFVHPRAAARAATTGVSAIERLQKRIARQVKWRRHVRNIACALQTYVIPVKKANIMAKELQKDVLYQFVLRLDERERERKMDRFELQVRVYNLRWNSVHYWTLSELSKRLDEMERVYNTGNDAPSDPFIPSHIDSQSLTSNPRLDLFSSFVGRANLQLSDSFLKRYAARNSSELRVSVSSVLQFRQTFGHLYIHVVQRTDFVDIMILELKQIASKYDHIYIKIRFEGSSQTTETVKVAGSTATYFSSHTFPCSTKLEQDKPPILDIKFSIFANIQTPISEFAEEELRVESKDMTLNSADTNQKKVLYLTSQILQLDEEGFFMPVVVEHSRDQIAKPPLFYLKHGMMRRILFRIYSPISLGKIKVKRIELGNWRWVEGEQLIHGGIPRELQIERELSEDHLGQYVTEIECSWDSSLHEFFYLNRVSPSSFSSGSPGFVIGNISLETKGGWSLSWAARFVNESRNASPFPGKGLPRSSLHIWHAELVSELSSVKEYVRGEESLGPYYVLSTKDNGASMVTRVLLQSKWEDLINQVDISRSLCAEFCMEPNEQEFSSEAAHSVPFALQLEVDLPLTPTSTLSVAELSPTALTPSFQTALGLWCHRPLKQVTLSAMRSKQIATALKSNANHVVCSALSSMFVSSSYLQYVSEY